MVVTSSNYKKNKRVKIRKESEYYYQARNLVGTMRYDSFYTTYIRVIFDTGYSNTYRISGKYLDLEFAETIHELWT